MISGVDVLVSAYGRAAARRRLKVHIAAAETDAALLRAAGSAGLSRLRARDVLWLQAISEQLNRPPSAHLLDDVLAASRKRAPRPSSPPGLSGRPTRPPFRVL